ncbi:phage Gp37/Gp68 family protein [Sporomusa sphaeroides DSM 2875]|uniref:DUF5131 family protein n=1 Tax=Sporomusa sphaeroides TaxID=47679 RepID=UPI00203032EB|nr:phage Gp37/Gp68 family protein [Sporomusa sphaeroides]MCM0759088.1 phage Gp37/Gp68 family protein [Sporomusa sphaeroides DSM 2875]
MGSISKIEWTESTWNPVTGCTKITAGCANCYAYIMARRLHAMGNPRYANGFNVTLHNDLIRLPLTWKKPRRVFVNSMSDLFHEEVPIDFIVKVFEVMNVTPWHNYQILTKRTKRLVEIAPYLKWTPNIWQGATIENSSVVDRLFDLKQIPANIKFLSLEPLIGPLNDLDLDGIQWVIVGGESGAYARPIMAEWIYEIRDHCVRQKVPFFFKQWGGFNKKKNGRLLEGRTWDEMPDY